MKYAEIECRCGCGEAFSPSKATHYCRLRGDPVGFLIGHAHRGPRNNRWSGGESHSNGYKLVVAPLDRHGARASGYILEHRLVMSKHLARPLRDDEIVHHINGDKTDNRIENLEIMGKPDHTRHHMTGDSNPHWKPDKEKVCPACGQSFLKRWNQSRDTYCSRPCMNQHMTGSRAPNAKLTDAQKSLIVEMRRHAKVAAIAVEFGVSATTIKRVIRDNKGMS